MAGSQGRDRERGGSTSTGLYLCPVCVSFCARARAKCEKENERSEEKGRKRTLHRRRMNKEINRKEVDDLRILNIYVYI